MATFNVKKLGQIMEPEPGNPLEIEGCLNPAVARARNGNDVYIFPRIVAKGNYSRIGIAKVIFDEDGTPYDVERMGIVLEPEADYEKRSDGGGGCEDPRITFVKPLNKYVMTYTAFSNNGPRIALATSDDLFHWQRHGLVQFSDYNGVSFNLIDNKDSCLFPDYIPDASGKKKLAIMHRPLFPGTRPEEIINKSDDRSVNFEKESIWISYCDVNKDNDYCNFSSHIKLASPTYNWEKIKIGTGAPPVLTNLGWMVVYHGVSNQKHNQGRKKICYSAGIMILSEKQPTRIIYRSIDPIAKPETPYELVGTVSNVIFPTGIDRRDDIGLPNDFDVYYGMADSRIGVLRITVPDSLPLSSII